MLFVKIYLGLLMIVIIFAIHNKAADLLLLGIPLAFISLFVGVFISSFPGFYDIQEETKDLTTINNESYYEIIYPDNYASSEKYVVCVKDNDEISHIEKVNSKSTKIEYSTVAENGQLIVKYFKLKPKWEHKMFGVLNGIKFEVILRYYRNLQKIIYRDLKIPWKYSTGLKLSATNEIGFTCIEDLTIK